MIRKFLKTLIWLLPVFFLLPGSVRADSVSPDELVKGVTEEVLSILRQDKGIQSGNKQRAMALIEKKVAPHFDFSRMTSLAVGRAWQQADAKQREALTAEFHTLLVRTYANSLTAYRDQTVSFKPSKQTGDEVLVRSQINKPGNQPISLDYSLSKSGNDWKVFDVAIANISLVTNYRGSFASEVEKGGIDGLLKTLQEKNRKGVTDQPPAS
ncbi:ABC transporter substrate-binding protein [Dechloromonas sp. XY25]|uniref:ABC transporter substrate-binding protein n=1 Tax=Dechloromonas hankyongensis TaxID=2908002 RepID=A0ABS9K247_9RHOO|nr:ABC transporter substrate-binding protein [Dechloromonas hankyongensis]MCG2577258.1 ABC transporter substrate-binding protein [Dechloromonas hankyongensis]